MVWPAGISVPVKLEWWDSSVGVRKGVRTPCIWSLVGIFLPTVFTIHGGSLIPPIKLFAVAISSRHKKFVIDLSLASSLEKRFLQQIMRQWPEAESLGIGAKRMFGHVAQISAAEYWSLSVGGQYP